MSDQPIVVARKKAGGFTKTYSVREILATLAESLPVDKIYFPIPHPDGKGYDFREAGTIVLTIQEPDASGSVEVPELVIPTPAPPVPPSLQEPYGTIIVQNTGGPTPPPRPTGNMVVKASPEASNQYQFGGMDEDLDHKPRPKSQAELLAERGIIEPPPPLSQ